MVNELEVPFPNARLQIHRDQAFGEEIIPGPIAAVHIQCWSLYRQINQSCFGIDGDLCPHSRITAPFPRAVFPRFVTELAGIRNRIESPGLLTRADVERAN